MSTKEKSGNDKAYAGEKRRRRDTGRAFEGRGSYLYVCTQPNPGLRAERPEMCVGPEQQEGIPRSRITHTSLSLFRSGNGLFFKKKLTWIVHWGKVYVLGKGCHATLRGSVADGSDLQDEHCFVRTGCCSTRLLFFVYLPGGGRKAYDTRRSRKGRVGNVQEIYH